MSGPDVSAFNSLSADEAKGLLRTCLDVPRWVDEVEGGRPFAGWPALREAAELAAGNVAYEQRFDRVFLIRAAGRSADEILAELERRLENDDAAERDETVRQLREIAVLRLESEV